MLIYSGDLDAQVPHGGTEAWTRGLGYAVKETWRPWSVDGAVAGNVVEYDVGGAGQFLFATVRGAGHMAPTFQPRSAQVDRAVRQRDRALIARGGVISVFWAREMARGRVLRRAGAEPSIEGALI